jgi:hypothetical protein
MFLKNANFTRMYIISTRDIVKIIMNTDRGAHIAFMCSVWISEQTAIFAL